MKRIGFLLFALVAVAGIVAHMANASGQSREDAAPIYGVKIPAGYRNWQLIAVNHLVAGKVDQLRAQVGNDIAIKAFQQGTLPFPDGSIIVAMHWTQVPSEENDKILMMGPFPGAQSFVIGSRVNAQFMVKDSKKYAASGGWGFADFTGDKPGDEALHKTCFPCHAPAKDRDYVFARYAP
jgi:hypothetical protein